MEKHWKKIIAPVIIAIILGVYYLGISAIFLFIPEIPVIVKILMVGIPAILAGVLIYVLIERIKEIRSGEEDDLSNY